ncbi:FAD-binding oxidoreductase [Novosphingobium sp. M1R2S20]|uniref:FAD-binding oxidoreductase n=1 Tax=Novosphingobium rhizovicinum TaxID=3228928 RepID=A0ABV3R743_9SPHN
MPDWAQLDRALGEAVGPQYVGSGDCADARFRCDVLQKYVQDPLFVVRPGSTLEVATCVRIAAEHGVSVTAVGGQTGTVGGAITRPGGIALSLERMAAITAVDTRAMAMTVQAGCILQVAQEAAEAQGAFLPLDLGSRGSATIGGSIAANAGGNRVLRWGMMRDMVTGLEVVLADGTVVSSLTTMLKDNAGFPWKQLMIGTEGTLGIVTQAVLRLRPRPVTDQTALLAVANFHDVEHLLRMLEVRLGGRLSSFELMWGEFYSAMTQAQLASRSRPLEEGHAFYVLVEMLGGDPTHDAVQFEEALTDAIEDALVRDAVVAKSGKEREALWAVREDMSPGLAGYRPFSVYDVSMRLSDMPAFTTDVRKQLEAVFPDARVLFYGHAGDGNLHAVVNVGPDGPAREQEIDTIVYEATSRVGGSIAAEHGIGQSRAMYLSLCKSKAEIELMRRIKRALDPLGVLNPGKVLE